MTRCPPLSRILPSEITPPEVFFNRRAAAGGAPSPPAPSASLHAALRQPRRGRSCKYSRNAQYSVDGAAEQLRGHHRLQQLLRVRHGQVRSRRRMRGTLQPQPWSVTVDGEAEVKGKFTLEDILKPHALEERIYRFRCVEAWSMVVPWLGFPLGDLVKRFKPTSKARYVEFTTLHRSEADARAALRRARLAVRRRPAHGRGDASAHADGRRPVRQDAAEPERRAAAAHRAVEVRLQGRASRS